MRAPRPSDPRSRLLFGVLGLALSGLQIDHQEVSEREQAVFRRVNDLPDRLHGPAWLIMQAGTIGAVPAAATLAYVAGRRALAGRLLAEGTATWLLAKVVKRVYRRPRPTELLATARCRGQEATGMGYVSGHAGIAVTLASAAWPELGAAGRTAAVFGVPLVGGSRMYVGAHLPLDVAGGAALGLAVDGATGWWMGRRPLRPCPLTSRPTCQPAPSAASGRGRSGS